MTKSPSIVLWFYAGTFLILFIAFIVLSIEVSVPLFVAFSFASLGIGLRIRMSLKQRRTCEESIHWRHQLQEFWRRLCMSAAHSLMSIAADIFLDENLELSSVQGDVRSISNSDPVVSVSTQSARRAFLGRTLGVISVVFMLLSGWGFHWEKDQLWVLPTNGLNYMLLGAVTLGAAVWLLKPVFSDFRAAKSHTISSRIRWKYVTVGAIALLVFAETSGHRFIWGLGLSQHIQFVLLAGGSVLTAAGLGGFKGFRWSMLTSRSSKYVALIMFIGLALRIWHIDTAIHLMVDEVHFFDGVLHLRTSPNLPLLQPLDGIATFPHIFSYFESWTVALIGGDFAGIRLASSLFGTLTIGAVYLMGRSIADHKLGLIAAALLAVFPPHIHFSRLALNNIADPLFGALAIAFLLSALRSGRQRDYVLAGLALGWTSYFYEGGRLLSLSLFVTWLIIAVIVSRPQKHWRGILITGLAAFLTMMPYYYNSFSHSYSLSPRLIDQGRAGYLLRDMRQMPAGEVLLAHGNNALRPAIYHVVYAPDNSRFYYGGHTPILMWHMVPFFLLGLFFALFCLKSGILLWLWLIFGLLGISFVVSTDWTVRYVALFPAMMVAVAIGLRYPFEMLLSRRSWSQWYSRILTVIIVFIGTTQVVYYFTEHVPVLNLQLRGENLDFYDVFDRAADINGITRLIYVSEDHIFPPILESSRIFQNIDMQFEVWRPSEGFYEKLIALSTEENYAFAVDPADSDTWEAIRAAFPVELGPWSSYDSVPRENQYALYIYRPSAVQ